MGQVGFPGVAAHHVSSSLLGPIDPSFRALSGRLKFTVRRHQFNTGVGVTWFRFRFPGLKTRFSFGVSQKTK